MSVAKNETTVKANSTSEAAPPNALADHLDPEKGVVAEIIYESGHIDVNTDICPDLGKNVELLIAITSAPSHEASRMAIRQTWGHYTQRRDVAVTFMLGSTSNTTLNERIKQEQLIYGDIIRGPAYLLPARLAKELYTAALNHTYFKLEDVFVTGIVANSLKIKRIHAAEFLNKRVPLTACSAQKGISIHMIKGPEQYDLWKKLLDGLTKCTKRQI
ncbi:hypothetical protein Trydic_g257 [Trypoxylus dichotomus]